MTPATIAPPTTALEALRLLTERKGDIQPGSIEWVAYTAGLIGHLAAALVDQHRDGQAWLNALASADRALAAITERAVEEAGDYEPAPRRDTHCSCGRPVKELLDGGKYGPTGWCGISGNPPLDPCDCGAFNPHDKSVCHIYGNKTNGLSATEPTGGQ